MVVHAFGGPRAQRGRRKRSEEKETAVALSEAIGNPEPLQISMFQILGMSIFTW